MPKLDASVAIVARNRPQSLSKALEAISLQSYPHGKFEVIVVDDGSTEDVKSVAQEWQKKIGNLRYLRTRPMGLAAGRNYAATEARSPILLFTDNDCLPQMDWVKQMLSQFKGKGVIGVEGKITTDLPRRPFTNAPENLAGSAYIGANSGYLKKTILELKYFEPLNIYKDDSEFAFRAMEQGRIAFAEKAVVYHPLRKYPPLRLFDGLFRLKNDWLTIFRHPKKYFRYIGLGIFANLLKSVFSCAVLAAILYGVLAQSFLPVAAAAIILLAAAFSSAIKPETGTRGAAEYGLFILLNLIYYSVYPLFLVYGFFGGLSIHIFSGGRK